MRCFPGSLASVVFLVHGNFRPMTGYSVFFTVPARFTHCQLSATTLKSSDPINTTPSSSLSAASSTFRSTLCLILGPLSVSAVLVGITYWLLPEHGHPGHQVQYRTHNFHGHRTLRSRFLRMSITSSRAEPQAGIIVVFRAKSPLAQRMASIARSGPWRTRRVVRDEVSIRAELRISPAVPPLNNVGSETHRACLGQEGEGFVAWDGPTSCARWAPTTFEGVNYILCTTHLPCPYPSRDSMPARHPSVAHTRYRTTPCGLRV